MFVPRFCLSSKCLSLGQNQFFFNVVLCIVSSMVRTMYVIICGCAFVLPLNACGWALGFPLQLWSWQPAPLPDQEVKRALWRDVPTGPPDFKDRDPCCVLACSAQAEQHSKWLNTKGACTSQHMPEQILPNALKPSKALIYQTQLLA